MGSSDAFGVKGIEDVREGYDGGVGAARLDVAAPTAAARTGSRSRSGCGWLAEFVY